MNVSKVDSPIFVVSTGRSGSQMIAKTLAMHPHIFALHEPSPDLNVEAYAQWNGNHQPESILNKVDEKRTDLISQVYTNNFIYLESSHYCSHLIPILDELYDARFIHLYRDGRDFVVSGLNRKWWYPGTYSEDPLVNNPFKQFFLRKIRRFFMMDVGQIWNDHRLNPPKKYSTRIEKISWLWVEINRTIKKHFRNISPANKISIKLERFNKQSLKELFEFSNIRISDRILNKMKGIYSERPNKTKQREVEEFSDWSDKYKKQFWKIAQPMMKKLNYN